MQDRLRPADHARLLQLLQGDMPKWFIKLFKQEVDRLPYGEEYAKGAQRMWDAIVEGYSSEDYKGPIAYGPAQHWPWAREFDDEYRIQEQRERHWAMRESLYTPEDIADIARTYQET